MKKIISIFFVAIFMFSMAMPTFAAETTVPVEIEITSSSDDGIMPIADVYEWYYKLEDGYMYMRQWNRTQGYWMTDWILVT